MRGESSRRAGALVTLLIGANGVAGPGPVPFADLVLITGPDSPRSLAPADIDGDGDLDLFVASSGDHRIAWLQNNGLAPPGFTLRLITGAAMGAQHVVAADINGDGRIDAVSAAFGANRISWHENIPGVSGAPPTFTTRTITSTAAGAQCVAVGDINADGHPDVAVASFNDNSITWRQQVPGAKGAPPTWLTRVVSSSMSGATWVEIADVDLDGDLDLIGSAFNGNRIAWFDNQGGSPPTFIERPLATGTLGVIAIHAADFDADGDIDVASACFNSGAVRLHRNMLSAPGMGPPTFDTMNVDSVSNGPVAVNSADVDADGDLDIMSTTLFGNAVAWHELAPGAAPEDPPTFTKHTIGPNLAAPRAVIACDLDADEDLDLVSCSQHTDRVTLHDNTLPRVFNLDTGTGHQTMHEALASAMTGHTIAVDRASWIPREFTTDFAGVGARVESPAAFAQPAGATYTLADGASIHAAPDQPMTLAGASNIGEQQRVVLEGWPISIPATGAITAEAGSTLDLRSSALIVVAGDLRARGALIAPAGLRIDAGATLETGGLFRSDLILVGDWLVSADTLALRPAIVGAGATITVQSARLDLRHELALLGELRLESSSRGAEPPATLALAGPLTAGTSSAIIADPGAVIECASDVSVPIADHTRFDLSGAALRFVGPGMRTLEAMSDDQGAVGAAMIPGPGRYPIGSIHIASGVTLSLVDLFDNAPDSSVRESLYVGELVIEAGGSLVVEDLRLYCEALTSMGDIDRPGNVAIIGSCPGDVDGDLFVGFADLNIIVSNFNAQGAPGELPGDIDADGLVGFSDLNTVISAFNTDC